MNHTPWLEKFTTWLRKSNLVIRCLAALILNICFVVLIYVAWQLISKTHDFIGENFIWTTAQQSAVLATKDDGEMHHNSVLISDPNATLNPSWRDRFGSTSRRSELEKAALSASGYPIVRVLKPTAVCSGPLSLQLASDLQRANRLEDVDRNSGCLVLNADLEAEWIDPNPFDNGTVALRLHPRGSLPLTVYGPDPRGGDSPFYSWYGRLIRNQ